MSDEYAAFITVVIGRSPKADVTLTGAKISRFHAEATYSFARNEFLVVDRCARNGVKFLGNGGREINSQKSERTGYLRPGELFLLGDRKLGFDELLAFTRECVEG